MATNIVVTLNSRTLVSGTDYTVSNNDGGVNAGNYSFTVNGIGNYSGSKNGTFTINKVTPTVVIPVAKALTYQKGVAQELVTAGSTNYGTMKYSTDGETYSTSVPSRTRAGSYTVYYFVEGDSNVNSTEVATVACSINEKPVTATIELSQDTYTYDGSAKEPTVTVKDGGDVIDPSEYTVTYSNNTNAGTASVTITDNTAGDYNVSGVTTFTINKANPTYTAPTATSPTYNGSAQALLNAGSTSDGTIQYSIDESTWGTTIPSQTNANAYTSYWRIVGDSNHNDVASTSIITVINKVTPTVTAPTAKSLTYNGSAQALVNAGSTNYGTLKYSLDNSSYSTSIPSGTNATSYTVYYKVDGDSNINDIAASSVACSIGKADQAAPTATGATTTYNTTATATASGGGGQGSLEWESAQSQTSVGSHSTRARWSGNSNYNASPYSNEVTLTMNKASQSAPTATGATVYYGSTATATASGGGGQGSLEWSNGNTRTALGSQSTSARWSGNGNYNASSWSNSVTLTVNYNTIDGHAYVEIGGLKWATMNVGATSETDYGLYFAWGETQGYTANQVTAGTHSFSWENYKYGNGTSNPRASGMTKYNSTDGKTVLDLSDDTARANWGGRWRMPTTEEFQALGSATTSAWTADYQGSGVSGLVLTSKADSNVKLFFPAASRGSNSSMGNIGREGYYWSSSLKTSNVQYGYLFTFESNFVSWNSGYDRRSGFSVRPVIG